MIDAIFCYYCLEILFFINLLDLLKDFNLSDISNLAQVIISIINLFLVFYVVIYQRNKDNEQDRKNIVSETQSINLQWFKELAVQPNLQYISYFYDFLSGSQTKFTNEIDQNENRRLIVKEMKDEYNKIRISFVDILESIDNNLHSAIAKNFEDLIDTLSQNIIDMDVDFTDPTNFNINILTPISKSRKEFISEIFNYKGSSK